MGAHTKYTVIKVFNNNVLLVSEGKKEKILLGKGIGFGKHPQDSLENNHSIEKIFSLEDESSQKFTELITMVDAKVVGICEEIIYMLSQEMNEDLDEKIHISLTDHIAFCLHRLRQNDEISNPFLIETKTLYKKEFALAKKAVAILEKETGLQIPEGEAGFIALHIHSARNRGKLSNTLKYTSLASSITELIEHELHLEIDKTSLDYARFLTHIRFAIERLINQNPIENRLLKSIKREYKEAYKVSLKVGKLIEETLNLPVAPDEIGYIAAHIAKLQNR